MPPASARGRAALQLTQRWLKAVIASPRALGRPLCPFAAQPLRDGTVRVAVTEADDEEALLGRVERELDLLFPSEQSATTPSDSGYSPQVDKEHAPAPTTTLLVACHPSFLLPNFRQQVQASWKIMQLIQKHERFRGKVQVVNFHPSGTHNLYKEQDERCSGDAGPPFGDVERRLASVGQHAGAGLDGASERSGRSKPGSVQRHKELMSGGGGQENDTEGFDPADVTAMSPLPTFHLLREEDIMRAVQSGLHAQPDLIPHKNATALRQLGAAKCRNRLLSHVVLDSGSHSRSEPR